MNMLALGIPLGWTVASITHNEDFVKNLRVGDIHIIELLDEQWKGFPMKGKIEITLFDSCNITIKGDVHGADECDYVLIFDTLADALELTELERKMVGVTIFAGGMAALGGPKANTVRISSEMLGVIDRMKNKDKSGSDTLD